MKLNWAERWVVNNPYRVFEQTFQIRWMKKVMPLSPGSTILEVGCGRGAGAGLILDEFQPAVLHAMDLDYNMIRKADRYLPPAQRQRISMYAGDVMNLPYEDGVMDGVFGFGVLHHVPDWRSALAEVARVMKVGGVYYLEELYPTVYQNFITKHILLHPAEDRFLSRDLHEALKKTHLSVQHIMEAKLLGILAVLVKEK
jgi:ubiquinone/menaquinone biosynthesis C-methylase UbiE